MYRVDCTGEVKAAFTVSSEKFTIAKCLPAGVYVYIAPSKRFDSRVDGSVLVGGQFPPDPFSTSPCSPLPPSSLSRVKGNRLYESGWRVGISREKAVVHVLSVHL